MSALLMNCVLAIGIVKLRISWEHHFGIRAETLDELRFGGCFLCGGSGRGRGNDGDNGASEGQESGDGMHGLLFWMTLDFQRDLFERCVIRTKRVFEVGAA